MGAAYGPRRKDRADEGDLRSLARTQMGRRPHGLPAVGGVSPITIEPTPLADTLNGTKLKTRSGTSGRTDSSIENRFSLASGIGACFSYAVTRPARRPQSRELWRSYMIESMRLWTADRSLPCPLWWRSIPLQP